MRGGGNWLTADTTTYGTSAIGNPYLFTGRRWDSAAQLYYYRFRDYAPLIGRFCQTDPLGYIDGLNLYAYVNNNPLNWIDPWGLWANLAGFGEAMFGPDPEAYFHVQQEQWRRNEASRQHREVVISSVQTSVQKGFYGIMAGLYLTEAALSEGVAWGSSQLRHLRLVPDFYVPPIPNSLTGVTPGFMFPSRFIGTTAGTIDEIFGDLLRQHAIDSLRAAEDYWDKAKVDNQKGS